jgi:hypothetical protein
MISVRFMRGDVNHDDHDVQDAVAKAGDMVDPAFERPIATPAAFKLLRAAALNAKGEETAHDRTAAA